MNSLAYDLFDRVRALRFDGNCLQLLDQRKLPQQQLWFDCADDHSVGEAIKSLAVRGAPAIGIAAAYGVVLAARSCRSSVEFRERCSVLRAARPTAVNLMWAIDRMLALQSQDPERLLAEAKAIELQDLQWNRHMGTLGAELIEAGSGVLTHCNTGSLATAGFGTALGVIRAAYAQGKLARVFAAETRPWLQGARLTSWELLQDGIASELIADGAGAYLMSRNLVQWVIVGADRICANGDVANKIGTLAHAAAAKQFGARVMVVAPSSTVDMETVCGQDIHIEEREPSELLAYAGQRVAAEGVQAFNPVFDVTPAHLIDAIVTERGVIHRPNSLAMRTWAKTASA